MIELTAYQVLKEFSSYEKSAFFMPWQHTNLNSPTLDITGSLSSADLNLQLFYNI